MGRRLEAKSVAAVTERAVARGRLSGEQADAIGRVVTSRRRLDLLVGPAGAGKTTAMRALRKAWVAERGHGSVVGLAPSAAAAKVMAEDLGIGCDNTAKWLHEHDCGNAEFAAGQLVIIDEATLANTRTLDRITGLGAASGAKVLLVGDDAQLQSADAGGPFSMLAHARGSDLPQLTEIHRFSHDWEKEATTMLRKGERLRSSAATPGTIGSARARPTGCSTPRTPPGARTPVVASTVSWSPRSLARFHALNARARAERILAHDDSGPEVELAEGARASAGDIVITRKNDRRLRALNGGWVRNGDRWLVLDVRKDGSLAVCRIGKRLAATVVLPPEYVAQNVHLGYAITAQRAQGITVDTAHVVASASTTRENLYVSIPAAASPTSPTSCSTSPTTATPRRRSRTRPNGRSSTGFSSTRVRNSRPTRRSRRSRRPGRRSLSSRRSPGPRGCRSPSHGRWVAPGSSMGCGTGSASVRR